MANDTTFGLAAYLYTRDLAVAGAYRGTRVRYGRSQHGLISTEVAPFAASRSRDGREGSRYGSWITPRSNMSVWRGKLDLCGVG